jgi:hypothetical protein
MNDERIREAYERGLPERDSSGPLDDVSAERLRRLVEQEGSETERLRTLDLALSSVEGRRELDIVWSAARAARPSRRRWLPYATAAAAAAVLLVAGSVMLSPGGIGDAPITPDAGSTTRGAESPITLVGPVGQVAENRAARFTWRRVDQAERYTVVVVDTTGTEIFATETRDSSLALPDSVRLVAGREYLWWVQARLSDQSTLTAVTQRFLVK